eukprot:1944419-Rhodomonas_salina.4
MSGTEQAYAALYPVLALRTGLSAYGSATRRPRMLLPGRSSFERAPHVEAGIRKVGRAEQA